MNPDKSGGTHLWQGVDFKALRRGRALIALCVPNAASYFVSVDFSFAPVILWSGC